jgi:hypothetical protein
VAWGAGWIERLQIVFRAKREVKDTIIDGL